MDRLSKYPQRAELERYSDRVQARAVPKQTPPKRRWPNPALVGASIFLFRNLPRIR